MNNMPKKLKSKKPSQKYPALSKLLGAETVNKALEPKKSKPKQKVKKIEAWAVIHQIGKLPWYIGSVGMVNHYIDTLTVFESEEEASDYIKESKEYRNWSRNLKAKVIPVTITYQVTHKRI